MISSWAVGLGWILIYIVATLIIPESRRGRGYITRLLGKIIPPKSFWVPPAGAGYRYVLLLLVLGPLNWAGTISHDAFVSIFWPTVIGLYIDDYFNGGDDWKKRWESVKNKIKWKMVLPEPATQDVRGA